MQTYFLLDSSEQYREDLSCNVLLIDIPSVVRQLWPKKKPKTTIHRLLRSLKDFQLHDLSKAILISATSVQYMTICLQKLLESCINYEFSILHVYFHYCRSFQCCHHKNQHLTKACQYCTAQRQIQHRAGLAKANVFVITSAMRGIAHAEQK